MFETLLVLCGHTDDELGCGGTIIKYIGHGAAVHYATFCTINATLENEVKAATRELGIDASNLFLYHFQVREFKAVRQKILDEMILLSQKIKPDLVFMPSSFDLHQDHAVIYEEGLRAFKYTSILGYEMPWNNLHFTTSAFVKLTGQQVQQKIKAMEHYKSQSERSYMNRDFILALAKTRGVQINAEYAEAFEVIRWIH